MYHEQEIVHATANENLSIATGWLYLSIALGSLLTFTFFAAISTSFYCCQKPIKKADSSHSDKNNSQQKLLFPNVPSTVYPHVQSILQQEDNEVVDSLSPAYRELPSTHFSYLSSFNGSTTFDATSCVDKQSTTLPNSTKYSSHPRTTISSEQIDTQTTANDSQQNPSLDNPELTNDSSLSIRIATRAQDHQLCVTSSTSGILTDGDLTTQAVVVQDSSPGLENAIDERQSTEPAMEDQQPNEPGINRQQSKEPVADSQRLCAETCECLENDGTAPSETGKQNVVTYGSSRGASSFAGENSSPRHRAFSPDYYALTFRREGSMLSDDSGFSMRGASAFASSDQRRSPRVMSPDGDAGGSECERGASIFGGSAVGQDSVGSCSATKEGQFQSESLNYSKESLLNDRATSQQSTSNLHGMEISSRESLDKKTGIPRQADTIKDTTTFPSATNPSAITRSNAKTTSHNTTFVKRKATGIESMRLYSQNNNGNNGGEYPVSTIKMNQSTPRDTTTPIIILQQAQCNGSEPIKHQDTKSTAKTNESKLNTTYQSLRGASQLGEDDVCSDSDAFWESVSLSFAYESPNEEDVVSQFTSTGP